MAMPSSRSCSPGDEALLHAPGGTPGGGDGHLVAPRTRPGAASRTGACSCPGPRTTSTSRSMKRGTWSSSTPSGERPRGAGRSCRRRPKPVDPCHRKSCYKTRRTRPALPGPGDTASVTAVTRPEWRFEFPSMKRGYFAYPLSTFPPDLTDCSRSITVRPCGGSGRSPNSPRG